MNSNLGDGDSELVGGTSCFRRKAHNSFSLRERVTSSLVKLLSCWVKFSSQISWMGEYGDVDINGEDVSACPGIL